MSKPEGLFFIGEIATACGLSINALRFYESKGVLKPTYTDAVSGYRYYSRENLHRLRNILALKSAGLSLPEIKDYLDGERHTEEKIALLMERRKALDCAIESLQVRQAAQGVSEVYELMLPERLCLCRTVRAADSVQAITGISLFYDEMIRAGVTISRAWPEFCVYPDMGLLAGKFSTTDFTLVACLPVDENHAPAEAVLYPAGRALAVNYRGSYFELADAYAVLCRHMTENGCVPAGYPQEIYLEIDADGSVQPDDADNITRVIVPIACDREAQNITY